MGPPGGDGSSDPLHHEWTLPRSDISLLNKESPAGISESSLFKRNILHGGSKFQFITVNHRNNQMYH